MTNDEYVALRSKLAHLRPHQVQSEFGFIPASVEHLKQLLDSDASKETREAIYPLLLSESSRSKNASLQIHLLRRRVRDFPKDPLSLSGLAFGLATMQPENDREALALAEEAVELATFEDKQVKYCATNLARIALMLDDYEALQRAIVVLVEDAGNEREEDHHYEFDFLDRIDTQRCNQELLARYKALES